MRSRTKLSAGLSLMAILVVICLVLNMLLAQYKMDISLALSTNVGGYGDYSAEEVADMGHEVNVKQEVEGAVLLKNDNKALPLEDKGVTILGYASYAYVQGNGSGASAGKSATDVSMKDAFSGAGINVNTSGWSTLESLVSKPKHISSAVTASNNAEKSGDDYAAVFTDSVIGNYGDVAVITLGRLGGEGTTLELADLQPSENELSLLEWASNTFTEVVVLVNSPNVMELGKVAKYADAILWIGTTGAYGMEGVAKLLKGTVSPSGKTVDTWAYDMLTAPALYNVNDNKYANYTDYGYYQYEEGIYVGYRWYETAYAEGFWDSISNEYGTGYEGVVQYPFGYGLSYSTFSQTIIESEIDLSAHATDNYIKVEVENTGDVAAKEVVEIYLRAPYNQDENCGINDGSTRVPLEKADKVLVGFGKTEEIAPGAKETVTINFDTDALASYDVYGHNCYVLEKGEYEFVLGTDAHNEVDSVKAAELEETIVYNEDGAGARSSDKQVATNVLDDVTAGDSVYSETLSTAYLSRSSFAAGFDKIKANGYDETSGKLGSTTETIPENVYNALTVAGKGSYQYTYYAYVGGKLTTQTVTLYYQGARDAAYAETNYYNESVNDSKYNVTYGDNSGMKAAGLTLADMEGAEFDDERWDLILDAIPLEELLTWQYSQSNSPALSSIGKELGLFIDGACQIGADKGKTGSTWFGASCLTASSWNIAFAEEISTVYGLQAVYYNYIAVYAPSMNTHRTPLGARNIEYYSEDGFIAGQIGAAQVKGIQSTGTMVFLKHCLLNDNDTNRSGAITWVNEQALREIYALPYEICVKEADARGIMSSLNRVGMSWSHPGFYLSMVRDEWGFNGMIITDMITSAGKCTTSAMGLLSGIGMLKGNPITSYSSYDGVSSTNDLSKYAIYMLRNVAHYGLYQYVNSHAFDAPIVEPDTTWYIGWIILDVVIAAGVVLLYVFMVNKPLISEIKQLKNGKSEENVKSEENGESEEKEEGGNDNE